YLPGRIQAYITEEQWRRNRARLRANRQSAATPGAPRQGPALLTGLLVCARCGTHMNVRYRTEPHGESHTYLCNWGDPLRRNDVPATGRRLPGRLCHRATPDRARPGVLGTVPGRG